MNCPNCNAPLDSDSRFCENCGTPVAAPEAAPMEEMLAPAISTKNKPSKIKWIVLIVVGVLIIAGISVGLYFKMQADKKVEAYSEQISLGEKYLEELKYDDAIIAFTKAIEIEPKKEKPYFALVDVYIETKNIEKANEIIAQIEKLFPENVDVVDKQEEVAVIVEKIKAEEEKKKAEEEAAKKAKELKWIVPPDREYGDLREMNTNKYYSQLYGSHEYDKVVLVLGEKIQTGQSSLSETTERGLVDYNGNVLIEPSVNINVTEMGLIWIYDFGDPPKISRIDANGNKGQQTIMPMHMGPIGPLGKFVISENKLMTKEIGHTIADGDFGAVYACETVDMLSTGVDEPQYVAVNQSHDRITQDIYEDGFLGTENNICVCKDGKWGFIKDTGEEMIPFEYDDAYYFQGGLAAVCKDGKWGFIKPDGTVQKDFQFEQALPPYEGKAWVKYNGKWGVLDMTADGSAKAAPAKVPEVEETPAPTAPAPEAPAPEVQEQKYVAKDFLGKSQHEVLQMLNNEYEDVPTHNAHGIANKELYPLYSFNFERAGALDSNEILNSMFVLPGGEIGNGARGGMSRNEMVQFFGEENVSTVDINYQGPGYSFYIETNGSILFCDIDTNDADAPTTKILYKNI